MFRNNRPLFFVLLLTFSQLLNAQWQSQLIALDDPLYNQVEYLLLESGVGLFQSQKPWSRQEILFQLKRIKPRE